jgi:hypothetical protein
MSDDAKTGKNLEDGKTRNPVDPKSANPSLNSEVRATTAINSSVKPEDYPKEDREQQVRAATGKPPKGAS